MPPICLICAGGDLPPPYSTAPFDTIFLNHNFAETALFSTTNKLTYYFFHIWIYVLQRTEYYNYI